ncbi:hypothetical protein F2Q69_00021306, partial [Brassica cretica]
SEVAQPSATVFSGAVSSHTNPVFTYEEQSKAVLFRDIQDFYTPFTQESNVSSFSCLNYPEEPRQRQNQKRPLSLSASSGSVTSKPTGSNTSRSKRTEALNSDVWAWRKYGQKPIKGSPYPSGAKQIRRDDFIVTYTAEHNHPAPTHRNSLAGSTRQKSSDHPTTTIATYSSSPVTSTDEFVLPAEDLAVGDLDGDEDLLSLSDTVVSEDFF